LSESRDYILDVTGQPGAEGRAARPAVGRPYLSVRFACCNVYTRIYRSAEGMAYRGNCPKCAKPVSFRVGEGGTDARFFVVY
jgi:hypothetical protein